MGIQVIPSRYHHKKKGIWGPRPGPHPYSDHRLSLPCSGRPRAHTFSRSRSPGTARSRLADLLVSSILWLGFLLQLDSWKLLFSSAPCTAPRIRARVLASCFSTCASLRLRGKEGDARQASMRGGQAHPSGAHPPSPLHTLLSGTIARPRPTGLVSVKLRASTVCRQLG